MSRYAIAAKHTGRVFFTAFTMILLAAFIMKPAYAERPNLSPEYTAGFAFFKYAKVRPVFEDWIKTSKRYKTSSARERVHMLRTEPALLNSYFDTFAPLENPIELTVRARVQMPNKKRAEEAFNSKGRLMVPLKLPDIKDGIFPLELADMWIALVPLELEEMLNLRFTKDDYSNYKHSATETSLQNGNEALVRITFIPTGADTKAPLNLNGYELWMLRVSIIKIEIWDNKNRRMVWASDFAGPAALRPKTEIHKLYE